MSCGPQRVRRVQPGRPHRRIQAGGRADDERRRETTAAGFLLKDALDAELLGAVRAVAGGHNVAAPTVTRRLVQHFVTTGPPITDRGPLTALTTRERQVLRLIAEGLSNQEIGGRLVISEGTVKTHVSRILAKLGLRDRIHAVIYAYQSGVV